MKFLKEHWILVFALFLLMLMSFPLLYYGNLALDQRFQTGTADFRIAEHPAIGICLNSLVEPKWIKEKAIWMKEAKLQNLTLQIKIAHYSLQRQIEQINSLINQKVKVLLVVPVSRSGLEDVLRTATAAGIKVILDEEICDAPADLFVGLDYRTIGKMQAELATREAGAGNYVVFRGPKDSYQAEQLYEAQMAVLSKNPQYKVLAVEVLNNWSAEDAVLKLRTVITHQRLTGVIAPNDVIAEEIAKFLKEQKFPIPYLTGSGGDIAAYRRIEAGDQFMTVSYDYQAMAATVLAYAKILSGGKQVTATSPLVTLPGAKFPCRLFPVYPVTRNNVAAFQNR